MASPSICGGFLTDKRSMVGFTWTITTLLTLFAFFTSIVLVIQIHTHYRRMARYYQSDEWYQSYYYADDYNDNDNDGNDEGEHRGSGDAEREQEAYLLLGSISARSITFVSVYTMMLATGLSLYGSTAIVGFTSLRGIYIAPCFSSGSDNMRVGIFGGAVVIFANLLLVCAVILGEVRVEDYKEKDNNRDNMDDMEPYRVERIATVLAVACMFLSALYTIFAILLFLCYTSGDQILLSDGVDSDIGVGNGHPKTPLVSAISTGVDQRTHIDNNPGFITMENSSQGDAHNPGFITMENSSQGTEQ